MAKKKINSRTKGHTFEREIAKILNDKFKSLLNIDAMFRRVPLSGGFDKTIYPGDIITLNDELNVVFNLSLECKFYKDWKLEDLINGNSSIIFEWLEQASYDAKQCRKNRLPIVIFKKNYSQVYVAGPSIIDNYTSKSLHLWSDGNPPGTIGNDNIDYQLYIGMFDEFIDNYINEYIIPKLVEVFGT